MKLKDEPHVFHASSDQEIDDLWKEHSVDETLAMKDTTVTLLLPKKKLQAFFDTLCVRRRYMFSVKKCGDSSCSIWQPPRLPFDVFQFLHHIPDPVPNGDRYKPFDSLLEP